MSKQNKYLKRPYPLYDKPWQTVIMSVLCVILVMMIFEPLQFSLNSMYQLWVLIHFAIVTALATVIPLIVLPCIFKKFYNPLHWTIGKSLVNCLLFFFFLSIFLIIYTEVLIPLPGLYIVHKGISFVGDANAKGILTDLLLALSIAVVPVSLTFFFTKNSILKQNLKDALELNRTLSDKIKSTSNEDSTTIILTGSTKEQVRTSLDNIIYIEAADNYMYVYYSDDDKLKHKLLRSTIKQIEEQLKDYPSLIRCHRAYIVNTGQIVNIEGNARGYKLKLGKTDKEIPVSRTYMQAFKDRIG